MPALRFSGFLLSAILVVNLALRDARADERTAAWRQTGALAAPEAIQAAAADERYAYAIANTVVAKYDRETGQRVATSTGAAKHLNSGFLWEGRLYCAHSNYPRRPEQSEILVLDRATMTLSTWKEFGNYGGSLTWAIRHDGAWWCNFARYGEENHESFLVKFNDHWQEQGRWTYPAELIDKLGGYSLSGGVWRDGSLWATDHDHRVLYRLRIPQAGDVLEFVETRSAPFTGQGIAHDPQTGGLVGIDRAKRQILFAEMK